MPRLIRLGGMALVLALLWACAGPSRSVDSEQADPNELMASSEPSIRGRITASEGSSVLVEENPDEQPGSAKAYVRLGPATVIRLDDRTPGTHADLKVGDSVSVWFIGPVAESYPVQATAGAIRIEDDSDGVAD